MNYKMMVRLNALILAVTAVFMLPALFISLYYGEGQTVAAFGTTKQARKSRKNCKIFRILPFAPRDSRYIMQYSVLQIAKLVVLYRHRGDTNDHVTPKTPLLKNLPII